VRKKGRFWRPEVLRASRNTESRLELVARGKGLNRRNFVGERRGGFRQGSRIEFQSFENGGRLEPKKLKSYNVNAGKV